MKSNYLISLEGGGTRSQAALMDFTGHVLHLHQSGQVNTNFVSFEEAQKSVLNAVTGALQATGIPGEQISELVSALVGPRFGPELFSALIPNARYRYYTEQDVVFARAGIYRPHGVAVVAATGATAWGVRADDHRRVALGGWGALLGDEGSAYAVGLLGLRAAVRAYEKRDPTPTALVEAICQHYGLNLASFHPEMIRLAYSKPLSRAEIAGFAEVVTRLAKEGDPLATRIVNKVAHDLASLALHAARRLFSREESFQVAAAGGLLNAGEMIIAPLRNGFAEEFPHSRLILGKEEPAVALGWLALYDIAENRTTKQSEENAC